MSKQAVVGSAPLRKKLSPRSSASPSSGTAESASRKGLVLADEVTLTRQFQRAVRLDVDFGRVDALRGYTCQGTARNVLEATARHVLQTPQRAFIWTGPFGGG